MRFAKVLVLVALLGMLAACSTPVPPTVIRLPITPLKKGAPLYVVASEQRARIIQALHTAGLETTNEWTDSGYGLEVKVGGFRGSRDCGSVNNVRYDLVSGGQIILMLKGRGFTGSCPDNIFDDMSRTLASYL